MKVWSIILSVLLLAGLAMAQTTGTESWVDGSNILHIPMTISPPTIDGEMDQAWYSTPVIKLMEISANSANTPLGTVPDDYLDLSCECRAMWDADYFYFFAKINDDQPGQIDATNAYENDAFELFFDGDNSKTPGVADLSGDDFQWRWVYGGTVGETSGGNDEAAWMDTDFGCNFEMRIPSSDLVFPLAAGHVFGFDIHLIDRDNGAREHKICWWDGSDSAWHEPSIFGTAMFDVAQVSEFLPIYKVSTPPTIDGESDEMWDAFPLFPTNCWVQNAEAFDFEAFDSYFGDDWIDFRVAYDDDYFYSILYKRDEVNANPSADHNNDSIEMYWDGDNSKGEAYDGVDDAQWRWISDESGNNFTNCEAAVVTLGAPRTGEDGYLLEFSAAFGAAPGDEQGLAFAPSEGDLIGFEVQTNDNDDEGADDNRETCARWWSDDNGSWANPSLFGTAEIFGEKPSAVLPEAKVAQDFALAQNYPNPFNPTTNIRYELKAASMVKLAVYDMLGRQVATLVNEVQSAGPQVVSFDASSMTSGVYFYKLEAGDQVFTRKMTLLK